MQETPGDLRRIPPSPEHQQPGKQVCVQVILSGLPGRSLLSQLLRPVAGPPREGGGHTSDVPQGTKKQFQEHDSCPLWSRRTNARPVLCSLGLNH